MTARRKTMTDRELYLKAKEALANAYAPYSGFSVGAACEAGSGEVYTGVNIENASYPAGICAERCAMSKAVSEGVRSFKRIAIASSGGEAWPCGICRQFMNEFTDSPEDLIVITGADEDHLEMMSLAELLPKGFRL